MSTGTTCTVYLDGVRVPDGSIGDDPTAPAALSGLEVAWGRQTTLDQPEAATATFTLLEAPGTPTVFANQLHTGVTVDIFAGGFLYADPTVPTFVDPTFDGPGPHLPVNATVTVGGGQLLAVPRNATRRAGAVLAPAPFSEDPTAWDLIPATSPGQTWAWDVRVQAAVGATITVAPVLFDGPDDTTPTPVGAAVLTAGTGGWVTASGTLGVDVTGAWVGLSVTTYPTGRRWADVPPSVAWDAATGTWQDTAALRVDDAHVLAPPPGTVRTVLVFSGRITDLQGRFDDTLAALALDVTAVDLPAELENRNVGSATPWPLEHLDERAARILDLSGTGVPITIAPAFTGIPMSWVAVANAGTWELLTEVATSVDGVLWSAVHATTGPYLLLEDPAARASLRALVMVDGVVVVVTAPTEDTWVVSACDVLRDPVTFVQSVSDVMTRAVVGWMDQLPGGVGADDATVTVIDTAAESLYGTRLVKVDTDLTTQADATAVAARLAARLGSASEWRVGDLVLDDATTDATGPAGTRLLLDLLDGTTRIGAPLLLTDLPPTGPGRGADRPLYLEGGQYSFEGGAWILAMIVSTATGQGQSAAWNELDPTWRWVDVDPELSWADVRGAAGPLGMERTDA